VSWRLLLQPLARDDVRRGDEEEHDGDDDEERVHGGSY
jgi:hypothetical protein